MSANFLGYTAMQTQVVSHVVAKKTSSQTQQNTKPVSSPNRAKLCTTRSHFLGSMAQRLMSWLSMPRMDIRLSPIFLPPKYRNKQRRAPTSQERSPHGRRRGLPTYTPMYVSMCLIQKAHSSNQSVRATGGIASGCCQKKLYIFSREAVSISDGLARPTLQPQGRKISPYQ